MKLRRLIVVAAVLGGLVVVPSAIFLMKEGASNTPRGEPAYEVDTSWPKPLPNHWILGHVAGIAIDAQDDVWLIQRPGSVTEDDLGRATGGRRAPPVLKLDREGNVLRAWGGPADCAPPRGVNPVVGGRCYEWPESEHGVFVDHRGNVWIGGNGLADHQVLEFSPSGRFLLQIGRAGLTGGDASTKLLGRPADVFVDEAANEVYVADGYLNHRVVVFDARTGRYRRHWGAYGFRPGDARAAGQFGNPVHCVNVAEDGLVYVCDRANNRAQVFRKSGAFVTELQLRPDTRGQGSEWDVAFSPDRSQKYLFSADGEHNVVWIQLRKTGAIQSSFGRSGEGAGEFRWVHSLAVDSRGNVYAAEVDDGKRAQRFRRAPSRPR